ncbi:hypothetical protein VSS74_31265, partial [Conexibacter stalactiti]
GAGVGAGPPAVAGSDAERRAALGFAARLHEAGRAVEVESCWLRPRGELAHALHAGVGVAASLLAVSSPPAGLALALLALLSLLLDLSGRLFLLRRLTPERATQNVVAAAPGDGAADADRGAGDANRGADDAVRGSADANRGAGDAVPLHVILTASLDVPRGGLLRRLARGRRDGEAWRVLPGPFAWVALALLAVALCAGARLAGAEGTALGAVQLVPTLVLLVALGLLVDAALARPLATNPIAPEVVLAAARALDAAPPRRLAVTVLLAGAGSAQALGFREHLRRRRLPPARTVVIEVARGDAAPAPTWWTRDGVLLPLRYHPQLVALAGAAAAEEQQLGARGRRGRALGAALRARQRRIPAIRLSGPDVAGTLALLLTLVELLDEQRG